VVDKQVVQKIFPRLAEVNETKHKIIRNFPATGASLELWKKIKVLVISMI